MSAPDFANFLASLGGDALTGPPAPPPVLPSTPIAGLLPMPAAAPPAPLTPPAAAPAPVPPHHGVDIAQLIGPMLSIGAALSGNPAAAAGAAHGYVQAQEVQREADRRQAQIDLENARLADEQKRVAMAAEQQRQSAIQALIIDAMKTAPQAPNKDAYDTMMSTYDLLGAQYGLRPNVIRQLVQYRPPNLMTLYEKAADAWLKTPANKQAYEDGNFSGSIMVDFGDGHPKPVPLADVLTQSGRVALDPTSGKPLPVPLQQKDQTAKFDPTIFAGLKDKWIADHGGQQPDKQALGQITADAIQKTAFAGKVIDPMVAQLHEVALALANQKLATGGAAPENRATLAQMVVDGRIMPSQLSKRATDYNATLASADQLSRQQTGKPINITKLQLDYEGAKRFITTMNGPQMLRFRGLAASVVNTIDEVRRLGGELQQGGVQFWNKARRDTALQLFGQSGMSETAAQYVGAVNTLKEEFAGLVQGGYAPTESAFALANQQINGNYSLKDLNASLTEVQRLVNYRIGAFDELKPLAPGDVPSGNQSIGQIGAPAVPAGSFKSGSFTVTKGPGGLP